MQNKIHRQDGFTLTELVVVVAILGLLLAVAAPNFRVFLVNREIRSAAESLQYGLRTARAEAAKRNQSIQFSTTFAAGAYGFNVTAPNACALPTPAQCNTLPINEVFASDRVTLGSSTLMATMASRAAYATPVAPATASVTFDAIGQVHPGLLTGTAGVGLTGLRIDVTSPLVADGARRLVVVVSPDGAVRICDPLSPVGVTFACEQS